jgi:hypothetical protein
MLCVQIVMPNPASSHPQNSGLPANFIPKKPASTKPKEDRLLEVGH